MEANAAEANAAEANTATTLAPAANTTEANAATITLATEVNAGLFGLLKTHLLKGPGDRPPLYCTPRLGVLMQATRVYIACDDPNPQHAGQRARGSEVCRLR
jgi:hypothetical protein